MAAVVHVVLRGVTTDQYEAVRTEGEWLEVASSGGLSHMTGWEGGDCHDLDSWEDEASFHASARGASAPPWPSLVSRPR